MSDLITSLEDKIKIILSAGATSNKTKELKMWDDLQKAIVEILDHGTSEQRLMATAMVEDVTTAMGEAK